MLMMNTMLLDLLSSLII